MTKHPVSSPWPHPRVASSLSNPPGPRQHSMLLSPCSSVHYNVRNFKKLPPPPETKRNRDAPRLNLPQATRRNLRRNRNVRMAFRKYPEVLNFSPIQGAGFSSVLRVPLFPPIQRRKGGWRGGEDPLLPDVSLSPPPTPRFPTYATTTSDRRWPA